MFVIDANKEELAIKEANTLGIPVVAILDSNVSPDGIAFPMPGERRRGARDPAVLRCDRRGRHARAAGRARGARRGSGRDDASRRRKRSAGVNIATCRSPRLKPGGPPHARRGGVHSRPHYGKDHSMADITAAAVKELREKSGAGMMDCKKALTETGGDMDAAVDWLRAKGLATAAKKSSRTAAEGLGRRARHGHEGRRGRGQFRDRFRRQERPVPGFRAHRRRPRAGYGQRCRRRWVRPPIRAAARSPRS